MSKHINGVKPPENEGYGSGSSLTLSNLRNAVEAMKLAGDTDPPEMIYWGLIPGLGLPSHLHDALAAVLIDIAADKSVVRWSDFEGDCE